MTITAQIGLPVQLTLPAGAGPTQATEYAAVITAVNGDGTVNVKAFPDGAEAFAANEVPAAGGSATTFYSFLTFS